MRSAACSPPSATRNSPASCAPDAGRSAGSTDIAALSTSSTAAGSSARQTTVTDKRPVDSVILAIVDSWSVGDVEKDKK